MSQPALSSERVHASAVAIGGRAVLTRAPGAWQIDLALRLIDPRRRSDQRRLLRRATV